MWTLWKGLAQPCWEACSLLNGGTMKVASRWGSGCEPREGRLIWLRGLYAVWLYKSVVGDSYTLPSIRWSSPVNPWPRPQTSPDHHFCTPSQTPKIAPIYQLALASFCPTRSFNLYASPYLKVHHPSGWSRTLGSDFATNNRRGKPTVFRFKVKIHLVVSWRFRFLTDFSVFWPNTALTRRQLPCTASRGSSLCSFHAGVLAPLHLRTVVVALLFVSKEVGVLKRYLKGLTFAPIIMM